MKLQYNYETSLISQKDIEQYTDALSTEINRIRTQPYAFLTIPENTPYQEMCKKIIAEKQALSPAALLVIGIGGSNMGARAVCEALYTTKKFTCPVYWADTLEETYIQTLIHILEKYLSAQQTILITIISKSGTTTETIINSAVFFELLKKYYPKDYHNYIIIITDRDSPLWRTGHELSCTTVEIPQTLGGRYSVFSAVGIIPLGILGIDTDALLKGASAYDHESAVLYAALLYAQYKNKKYINDLFLFCPALAALGAWYRQLMGESLGKDGKGIVPTVSIGTVDLHSVTQLYLDGPDIFYTVFIAPIKHKNALSIIQNKFSHIITQRTVIMHDVYASIFKGTLAAYTQQKRPYITLYFPELNEYWLGAYMQQCMVSMVYCAALMKVNPFNQPHVELYKEETRKFLSHLY